MTMRFATGCLLAVGALVVPVTAHGQAASTPALSPEESEAQSMGLQMAMACNPRRQGEVQGSASTIRRPSDALAGTAVLSHTAEGTFLALEQYDDALEGHCLVFGWFGGDLAPGRYAIAQLSYRAMEDEVTTGERSFYTWGAVRSAADNSMFLGRTGSIEISAIEGGTITGSFELTGFLVEGSTRTGEVTWAGSFSAVEME